MTNLQLLRIVSWLGVSAIVVLSLLPGQDRPHLVDVSQFEHLAAYGIVGLVLAFAYAQRRVQLAIGLGLTALAGALEIGQLWIPGRYARVIDWAAGSLGAWLGIGAGITLAWLLLRRRPRGRLPAATGVAD